jgi:hypothetical protein
MTMTSKPTSAALEGRYKPTDQQILAVVRLQSRMMTYVVRNILSMKPFAGEPARPVFRDLDTGFVRRRLMAMEKVGWVERVSSPYAVQICWRARVSDLPPC